MITSGTIEITEMQLPFKNEGKITLNYKFFLLDVNSMKKIKGFPNLYESPLHFKIKNKKNNGSNNNI